MSKHEDNPFPGLTIKMAVNPEGNKGTQVVVASWNQRDAAKECGGRVLVSMHVSHTWDFCEYHSLQTLSFGVSPLRILWRTL